MAERQRPGNVYQNLQTSGNTHLGNVYVTEDEDKTRFQAFLDSLHFPELYVRQEEIDEAHRNTFEWIFRPPQDDHGQWDSFVDWLRDGDATQPYWIEGKAGSGKSTLMQFVVEHGETLELLTEWTDPQRPYILSFFFWEAGQPLQKNSIGLLRSLLWQLFTYDKEKGKEVFRRMAPDNIGSAWTERRLLDTFRKALSQFDSKTCLFLDGLDEFDKPEILLRLIDTLHDIQHVKLCVSSRPLQKFRLAFRNFPKLRLQELTTRDMRLYIGEQVLDHPDALEVWTHSPRLRVEIQNTLLRRARGVFLWLVLAVRSLRTGIENADKADELRSRMKGLPGELEKLFVQMLDRAKGDQSRYGESAAYYFRLILHSELSLPQFAIAIDRKLQDKFLLPEKLADPGSIAAEVNTKTVKTWIQSRCAGLLEVTISSEEPLVPFKFNGIRYGTRKNRKLLLENERNACQTLFLEHHYSNVHFLHRTVRDFLTNNEQGKVITSASQLSEHDIVSDIYRCRLTMSTFGACAAGFALDTKADILDGSQGLHGLPEERVYFPLFDQTENVLNYLVRAGLVQSSIDWWQDAILRGCFNIPLSSPNSVDILLLAASVSHFAFVADKLRSSSTKSVDRRFLTHLLCLAIDGFGLDMHPGGHGTFLELVNWCLQQGLSLNEKLYDTPALQRISQFSLFHFFLICLNRIVTLPDGSFSSEDALLKLLVEHRDGAVAPSVPLKDLIGSTQEDYSNEDLFLCEYDLIDMVIPSLLLDDSYSEVTQFLEGKGWGSGLRLRLMYIKKTGWAILSARDSELLFKSEFARYELRKCNTCSIWVSAASNRGQGNGSLKTVAPQVYKSLRKRSVCLRSTTDALRYLGWTSEDLKSLLDCREDIIQRRKRSRTPSEWNVKIANHGTISLYRLATQVKRELAGSFPSEETPELFEDTDDEGDLSSSILSLTNTTSEESRDDIESNGSVKSDFHRSLEDLPSLLYLKCYEVENEASRRTILQPELPVDYPPERRYSI